MLLLPMQKVIRFVKYGVSQQIFYWRHSCFNSLHARGVEGWRTGADKVQSSANISECFYKTCCLQYEVMKSVSLNADCKCFLQIELMLLVSFHWGPTETRFLAFIFLGKKSVPKIVPKPVIFINVEIEVWCLSRRSGSVTIMVYHQNTLYEAE